MVESPTDGSPAFRFWDLIARRPALAGIAHALGIDDDGLDLLSPVAVGLVQGGWGEMS